MFSIGIFRILSMELDRIAYQRRIRFEQVESDWRLPYTLRNYLMNRLDPEVISEAKGRLASQLILINGGILIAASLAGYFLAGRTLKPIQQMVDDQKRFIADASHELRTPLTSLRSEIEVGLMDEKMNLNDTKVLLKSNLEEVIKLQSLTDKLLTLAKKNDVSIRQEYERVSLKLCLDNAIKKSNGSFKKKNIVLKKDIKEIYINAKEDRITELFVILLDNAMKYSLVNSEIKITLKIWRGMAYASIKDYGIGISKKELPHIFDRFYRADLSRTATVASGFGLGLSIARDIVKDHSGSIYVKSKEKKGSEFIVKFPL